MMTLFFHSCENLMVRIPSCVMICALLEIFKTPLVKTIGAKGLYLSPSLFSEAEDDIIKMISCLLDLETPTKHFSLSEAKDLIEYDTYNSNGGKTKKSTWNNIISMIRWRTKVKGQKMSVNLFSHDSDVLAKWNLTVAHHNQVVKLLHISSSKAILSLDSCRFFRRRFGPPANANSLGGLASRRQTVPNTVYDLSESPVSLTPESTLLIMLTNGSDYNTAIVSDSTYGIQIRSEAAMFENLSCTCISGWGIFLESVTQKKDIKNYGNVSEENMSKHPCGACGKYLVLPFWSTKFYYAAQAIDFMIDPNHIYQPPVELNTDISKHAIHRALAINAASNVMTYLTLGSFNQRIFGNMNRIINGLTDATVARGKRKIEVVLQPTKKTTSQNLSSVINDSKCEFFHTHTEGGIPLHTESLRGHKEQLFGNIFPPLRENTDEDFTEFLDYNTLFGDDENEKNDNHCWMAKATCAFASHNIDFAKILKTMSKTTASSLSTPVSPRRQQHISVPWDSLVHEFDRCLSCENIKHANMSILSKMTDLLKTGEPIKGVDDDRITDIPYSVKTMNLLTIVYMNMCGLEDKRIASGQLMPLIHKEYCSARDRKGYNTDRVNFMAAITEFSLLHYISELSPNQVKRQSWMSVSRRLDKIRKRTSVCVENCKRLMMEMNKSVRIPGRDNFMPVLGLAISWTPLTLWSSFIFCQQQQHI